MRASFPRPEVYAVSARSRHRTFRHVQSTGAFGQQQSYGQTADISRTMAVAPDAVAVSVMPVPLWWLPPSGLLGDHEYATEHSRERCVHCLDFSSHCFDIIT